MEAFDKHFSYDVALSFAEEDRLYAVALFKVLRQYGVEVFYDKEDKSTLWGKNLYPYLSDLYQNRARYCVMFLSKHYAAKFWTNHEREAAQARAFREQEEYILPVRLDDTEIPGILPTTAYLSWPPETAETIASAIITKLGRLPFIAVQQNKSTKSYLEILAQTDSFKSKEQWLEEGILYYRTTNYADALNAFERAIQLDSKLVLAYVGKGHSLYRLERYRKALAAYNRAIKLNPNIAHTYLGKGKVLYQLEHFEEALAAFEHAILLAPPNDVSAYYDKGKTLIVIQRNKDALTTFKHAIKLDSKNALFYNGLGDAHFNLNQYKPALTAYQRAIRLDPNLANAYFFIGIVL